MDFCTVEQYMRKDDHIFVSDLGMNVLKGNSLFNKPEAALGILKAIQKNPNTTALMAALSQDPTIRQLGGVQKCLDQLFKSGLITAQAQKYNTESEIEHSQETEDIERLKLQLVNLIEKTNHPEIWNFFLNVEAVKKKSDLVWVLNEIIKQIDPQIDEPLKKQYQKIFTQVLELRE